MSGVLNEGTTAKSGEEPQESVEVTLLRQVAEDQRKMLEILEALSSRSVRAPDPGWRS